MPEARRIVFRMLECDKPIIARVNGHAVGLGAMIALLCDIIIAAEDAKIGDPHVNAGLVAADGGALLWPQLIGFARAKEYLFTGDLMTAAEAERIGLINHVVPADQLDEKFMGSPDDWPAARCGRSAGQGRPSTSRRDKARTKPKRIISASVTIFTTSGASVRAPTFANGFIACQIASAGSLVMPTKIFSELAVIPQVRHPLQHQLSSG
jgi:enoyl-CoA hydratase/carnithine racemase